MKGKNIKKAAKTADKVLGNTSPATATAGEMTFTKAITASNGMLPGVELGPLKYLLRGMGRIPKGITRVFNDKKKLLSVLIIAFLWLILLLLPALGVNASALNLLSFLTFARGGSSGGMLGMVGGLIGKGFFAYFLTAMILPLFSGSKPFTGLRGGLRILFRSFNVKEKLTLSLLLLGAGLALFCYNFLTGNASLQNSMVGIAAFLLSLKALVNKGGFLRGLIMSFLYKSGKGNMPNTSVITYTMAGWAMGFALGIFLSTTGISGIGYLTGIIFIAASLIIRFISKNKKEAASV